MSTFFSFGTLADSKLPILKTKQTLDNLRYISADGSVTYFQRTSGSLLLSTNYRIYEIQKSSKNTQYYVHSTQSKKHILIQKNPTYQQFFDHRPLNEILISPYGSKDVRKVGVGTNPKFHLKDQWFTYYQPYSKKIHINNSVEESIKYDISLATTLNPYFIPDRVMSDSNTLFFTDVNQKGFPGVLKYTFSNKKLETYKKFQSPNTKVSICRINDHLIVAKSSFDSLEKGTTIYKVPFKNLTSSAEVILYQSAENDLINLVCVQNESVVYFIKTIKDESGKLTYEAASLNTKDKKLKVVGDLKFANQIINMDGNILISYLSNYYVLKGKSDYTEYDQLSKKEGE